MPRSPTVASNSAAAFVSPAVSSQWLACSTASRARRSGPEQIGRRAPAARRPTAPSRRRGGRGRGGSPRRPVRAAGRGAPAARGGTHGPGRRSQLPRSGVQRAQPRRGQVVEHRRPHQRMGDVDHAPAAAGVHLDEPVVDGLRQRPGQVADPGHPLQAVELERPGDGDGRHEPLGLGRTAGQTAEDERGVGAGGRERSETAREDGRVELVGQRHRRQRAAAGVAVQSLGGPRAAARRRRGRGRARRSRAGPSGASRRRSPRPSRTSRSNASSSPEPPRCTTTRTARRSRRRRYANESACTDGRSAHWASSTTTSSGRSRACSSASAEDHLADGERIGTGAAPGEGGWRGRPAAAASRSSWSTIPKSRWRSISSPRAHSTAASDGIEAATARASADLPMPAAPSTTRSCGVPTSARVTVAAASRCSAERPTSGSCARWPPPPRSDTARQRNLARTAPPLRRGSFRDGGVPRLGDRADDG